MCVRVRASVSVGWGLSACVCRVGIECEEEGERGVLLYVRGWRVCMCVSVFV